MNDFVLQSIIFILAVIALLLASSVWLKSRIAYRMLCEMSRTPVISTFRAALPNFERAVSRARRYQRPLSIAVVRIEDHGPLLSQVNGNGPNGSGSSLLVGNLLWDSLRETDIVAFDHRHNQYVVAMPEVPRLGADHFVARLWQHARRLNFTIACGVAEYPTDALTLEDLLKLAQKNCKGPQDKVVAPINLTADAAAQRTAL
jgi:hypothetical protein